MSTLILRLSGPMQSWGTQSRFTMRDAGREPSKSGVVGLLAAAQGLPRNDSSGISKLMTLRMAVRIDREGILRRDYQTTGGGLRPGSVGYGVIDASGKKGNAVLSNRYYLADADFRVALESDDDDWLHEIQLALSAPKWSLFLGRKAFIPACPIGVGVREKLSAAEALLHSDEKVFVRSDRERKELLQVGQLRAVVEVTDPREADDIRCDVTDSFQERDFHTRYVTTRWIELSPDMVQLDPLLFDPSTLNTH
jgi:CRISPR system Cascade subunit CasD